MPAFHLCTSAPTHRTARAPCGSVRTAHHPTAAGSPPQPAPSMARIARTMQKRATTCCLSRTAVNLGQIHGPSQRELLSCCRMELACSTVPLSCNWPDPQSSMNFLRSATKPRVLPRPLGSARDPAGQLCNRSVRIIRVAVAVLDPPSAHRGGEGRIQPSPLIYPRTPIASRQEEVHEATIRTCAHEAETLEILITPT